MKWLAVFFFYSMTAQAALVQMSSFYQDTTDSTRTLRVDGSGWLFSAGNRQLVLTASHVSQGTDLKVTLGGAPLTILGRLRDSNVDVELIEIKPQGSVDSTLINGQIQVSGKPARVRWIDNFNYVPLLDWITDPNLEIDNRLTSTNTVSALNLDILGYILHGEVLIQPGTSGAPLLTDIPSAMPYDVREGLTVDLVGKTVVRGLAIQRDRFFSHAGFIPRTTLINLVNRYLSGGKTKPLTTWMARAGVLFRITNDGNNLQETNSNSSTSIGGVVMDSGNGVSMDGGNLANLDEDSPKQFLESVSAFPVQNNQAVSSWLLIMRHPTTGAFINFWAWFDMGIYPALRDFLMATEGPNHQVFPMLSRLSVRLGLTGEWQIERPVFLHAFGYGADQALEVQFSVPGDVVDFQLNQDGALCLTSICQPRFQPVIEVPTRSGADSYIVDLRELFFFNEISSHMQGSLAGLTPAQVQKQVFDTLVAEQGFPRLSYRLKRKDISNPMTLQQGLRTVVTIAPPH